MRMETGRSPAVRNGSRGRKGRPGGKALVLPQVATQQVQAQLQHFLAVVGVRVGNPLHRQAVHQRLHERRQRARADRRRRTRRPLAGEIGRHLAAPLLVEAGEPPAEIVARADLRQKGVLQGVKLRHLGRVKEDELQKRPQASPGGRLRRRAPGNMFVIGPVVHHRQQTVEDRQEDVFLGREIIGQLPAAHAGAALDGRERQVLQPRLGDDGDRRLDDLLAPLPAHLAALGPHHPCFPHPRPPGRLVLLSV